MALRGGWPAKSLRTRLLFEVGLGAQKLETMT